MTSYQYDSANRLTSAGGVNYTFDANGNLLSDGVNTYVYDSANRLTAVSGQQSATYAYNGLGDRLSQDGVNYTLDLNTGLTQVLSDGTNTYTYGLGRISQSSTTTEYFLGDALGSVRQLTNTTGEVTYAKSYDPYGVVTQVSGEGQSAYGYTGEQQDVASGMVYLRSRYYNAADGRFQSRDTWGGDVNRPMSMNRWNYVEGNPANRTDPTGHMPAFGEQGINERDLTWWFSQELSTNAKSSYTQKIKTLMNTPINDISSKLRGLDAFKLLVQDKAKWDFKHQIKYEMQEAIVLFDNNADASGWWYEYSVPGNIHYGFVGRAAGMSGALLHGGAGFAEATDPSHLERDIFGRKITINGLCPKGPAGETCRKYTCPYINWTWIGSGFDEPRDWQAVETGIQLYDTYGANISFSQLIEGLTSRGLSLDHSGVKPDWTWSNPRGGWPYAVGRFNGPREAEFEPAIQSDLK